MELTSELWGNYKGYAVYLIRLKSHTMEVALTNFGATITAITMCGEKGAANNIVLGYDTLQEYIEDTYYIGSTIGRYTGRISNARFAINGVTYPLSRNEGKDSIHGGDKGFSKQVFTIADHTCNESAAIVTLHYRSPHLEEGYPGNLDVWVTYELAADNQLTISYKAITDADTHVNLTNHTYFNLGGEGGNPLTNSLFINADSRVVADNDFIPTGIIEPVKDTHYSFKTPRPIAKLHNTFKNFGYNECYVLNKNEGLPDAVLYDEKSGRKLSIVTDMPGILLYTGDFLGGKFQPNQGICLETQYYPDAPNHANFPSTLLKAGEEWNSYTKWSFE